MLLFAASIRTLELHRKRESAVVPQGANLVTVDVLESRVTAERYRNLLESAAAAHFSILRINGDAVRQ